jgi:hypothetical protein
VALIIIDALKGEYELFAGAVLAFLARYAHHFEQLGEGAHFALLPSVVDLVPLRLL